MLRRLTVLLALASLVAFNLFVAVGTATAAAGEFFTATLSGANAVPPITTSATGFATIYIDPSRNFILYDVSYSGLSGPVIASHIHLGAATANGPIILPFKVSPSPMVGILTAADLKPAGTVTSFALAVAAIEAGGTYVNVHTAANPGGEIRGQLGAPTVTPAFTITADQAGVSPKGHLWSFDDYFPRTTTIATGDTFVFLNQGFHTFTLLPTATTVAADFAANGIGGFDTDDTTPNKNGTKRTVFNLGALAPALPAPGCGSLAAACAFDGTATLSSGLPFAGIPEPLAVKVTAPAGTYTFHCRVHPHMTGTLNVVAAGAAGTTTADTGAAAAAAQLGASIAAAKALEASIHAGVHHNANGTITWTVRAGASTGDGRVNLLEFLPVKLKVHRGDKVVFRPTDRNEIHTVTFPKDIGTAFVPLCEGANGTDTPATPTATPPTSPFDFACNGHPADELEFDGGNGVRVLKGARTVSDSGLLAYRTAAPPGVALSVWSVRFAATASRGTYHYVCQIHEGMAATITVAKP